MKQHGQKSKKWAKLIQNAINSKAQASFLSFDLLRDIDQHIFRDCQLVKSANSSYKNAKIKDPKANQQKAKFQP